MQKKVILSVDVIINVKLKIVTKIVHQTYGQMKTTFPHPFFNENQNFVSFQFQLGVTHTSLKRIGVSGRITLTYNNRHLIKRNSHLHIQNEQLNNTTNENKES